MAGLGGWTSVDVGDVRVGGGLMLAAAVIRPMVPGTPGLPCPWRSLTGLPCPLCGMTRSVTACVHLDFGRALATNPAGPLVVALAVAALLAWRVRRVSIPAWMVPAGLSVLWLYQLFHFSTV